MTFFSSHVWYKKFVAQPKTTQYIALAGLLLGAGIVFCYSYKTLMGYRSAQSQQKLADSIALFDATARSKSPDWHKLGETLKDQYAEQPRLVTPALLSLLADVYANENNLPQALQTMDQVVNSLSSSDPLYSLYTIKRALMRTDSSDEKVVQDGLADLTAIATNKSLANWDEAAYYVGLYYWEKNDITQAKALWQDLSDMPLDIEGASPWAARVQAKLPLI